MSLTHSVILRKLIIECVSGSYVIAPLLFMIDQKVHINMPKGYKIIQTPPVKKLGEGSKAILKESIIHWPKKAQLLADSVWIVKTTQVDQALASVLREELNACLRWPVLDIPFRK